MIQNNSLRIIKGLSQAKNPAIAAEELYQAIWQPDITLAVFYCSPSYPLDVLAEELHKRFADINLIGCTTAGEITPLGYLHGSLTGISIAAPDFIAVTEKIDNLNHFEFLTGQNTATALLSQLIQHNKTPSENNTFAFLLIDGLSVQEESVVSALHNCLENIQLFGGSAGDETRFKQTFLYHKGEFYSDCALITLIYTENPFVVFKTEHFVESTKKMVITQANPQKRIVTAINGEPAAYEYARLIGIPVDQLTPTIFATHPVMVKMGGKYYVRSIQKVNDDGSLTFFCAVDGGLVLTIAKSIDLIDNLEQIFAQVKAQIGQPELVLGCDCILRHLEMDRHGIKEIVGNLMVAHNVIGFSTYGEQFNNMHINQTFTGVAIGVKGQQSSS